MSVITDCKDGIKVYFFENIKKKGEKA